MGNACYHELAGHGCDRPLDVCISFGDAGSYFIQSCIGCGLCVSTCPTGSLRLVRKPKVKQPRVPANVATALLRTAWKRKKVGPLQIAAATGRSQRDRYPAARQTTEVHKKGG